VLAASKRNVAARRDAYVVAATQPVIMQHMFSATIGHNLVKGNWVSAARTNATATWPIIKCHNFKGTPRTSLTDWRCLEELLPHECVGYVCVCVCCKVAYAGRLVYLFLVRRTLPLHGYLIVWHLHLQFPYPLTLPLAAAWQISEPHSLGVIERERAQWVSLR